MKKKEILEIIKLNLEILESKRFENMKSFPFSEIEELKEQFAVLNEEMKKSKELLEHNKELLSKVNCQHEIRRIEYYIFGKNSICLLCGKSISGDNVRNGNTIYNDINRNRGCVLFNCSYYDEEYGQISESGYDVEEVYQLIYQVLSEKGDDEEINLIEEMKKLNLNNCEIDERKKVKENHILIIGGSNKFKIQDESYITSYCDDSGIDLTYYLSGFSRTNVEYIDNKEVFTSSKFENFFPSTNSSNLLFRSYDSIKELEGYITKEGKVPFDLIVDLSNLYQYDFQDGRLTMEKYNIDLQRIFPNSEIVKVYTRQPDINAISPSFRKEVPNGKVLFYEDGLSEGIERDKFCEELGNKIKKLVK